MGNVGAAADRHIQYNEVVTKQAIGRMFCPISSSAFNVL
jgi:hypothetical protein